VTGDQYPVSRESEDGQAFRRAGTLSELAYAKSFRDLVVYQKARATAKDIFWLSKSFPSEERFSLTDQMRRSSRSVGAQIAEAWAKRRYPKHFISKLSDADGEQLETQHWIESALDSEYIPREKAAQLVAQLSEIGKMLNSMMFKAESFCQDDDRVVREEHADYFICSSEF
jgi:four helix bundle protein